MNFLFSFFKNQREEMMQRCAWRLVRSAEDRMGGEGRGHERLLWCVDRMREEHPKTKNVEDYVRAAYVNFRAEIKSFSF